MKFLALLTCMVLAGCATPLTQNGRSITTVNSVASELVSDCKRIGVVNGYAQPGWGNDVGLQQALNDARNKAGNIPSADTMAISLSNRLANGGEVTAFVYNCKEKNVQLIKNVTESGQEKPLAQAPSKDVFAKAKKCQEKGGVWLNSQCVISIE